jgi:hypothetical protein
MRPPPCQASAASNVPLQRYAPCIAFGVTSGSLSREQGASLVHCSTDDYGWSVERTAKQLFPYATCIEIAAQDTWSSQLVGPLGLGELL